MAGATFPISPASGGGTSSGSSGIGDGGLFKAILDAIFQEDNRIAGQAVTILTATLTETDVTALVEATNGFGENTDGVGDARLLVGGEIILASGKTVSTFTGLTRGADDSKIPAFHVPGTLVFDLSGNKSSLDLLRRGFSVNTAVGEDLDIIGANLGLHRCVGITQETWREIIKVIAYLPKNTLDAFQQALTALLGAGNFEVYESLGSASPGGVVASPYQIFVDVVAVIATSLRGRFVLNGGEPQLTTDVLEVETDHAINHVLGVYDDNLLTQRGYRDGFTNYFLPTGSFVGTTITLDSTPGGAGTPVIVDYGANEAHYLAPDETVSDDGDDFYAYLSDPTQTTRCILDLIRMAGVQLNIRVTT